MNAVAIAANALFIAAYAVFIRMYELSGAPAIYPLFIAPIVIYILAIISALGIKKEEGGSFMESFSRISPAFFAFIALFLSLVVTRINFPDPHNFIQRKMEIVLGASFILFTIACAGLYLKNTVDSAEENKTTRNTFLYIFFFYLIFYFSVSLWFNYANEPTGDETAYILRTHSMVFDGDLDLKNNFENQDYKKFYSRELVPQEQDIIKDGKIFSYHPVFYSFFIAPFYFAAGRLGASISTNVLAALLIAMIFYIISFSGFEKKAAFYAAMIAGFSMPLFQYVNIIATEIIGAFLVLLAFIMLKQGKNLLFCAVSAMLVWLHLRNLPLAGSLGLIYIYQNRKDWKALASYFGIMILAAVLLAAFNYFNYGVIFSSYSSGNSGSLLSNFRLHNIKGTLVMFLDRQLGLLPYAPVYAIIFSGAIFLFRANRRLFTEISVIFIPYYIMITSWHDWGIGNAGPRYFIPFIFIFPLLLSAMMQNIRTKAARIIFYCLSGLTFIISAIVACVPWFRWDKHPYENWIVEIISRFGHVNLKAVLPSYRIEGQDPLYLTAAWIVLIAGLNIYFAIQAKRKNGETS